jgi:hypothetical protein
MWCLYESGRHDQRGRGGGANAAAFRQLAMRDEPWIDFHFAVGEARKRLGLSRGAAEKKLQDACASREIRTWKEPYSLTARGEPQGEGPPVFVPAAEWRATEVDQATDEDGCHYWVRISKEDFEFWLDQQPKPRPKPAWSQPKRALALQAIDILWPDGIPNTVPNKQLEKQVGERIAEDCKRRNLRMPEISRDTILRAARRKASAAK